jgi:hypothetical protein
VDKKPIFTRTLLEQAAEQVKQFRNCGNDSKKQIIHLPHLLDSGWKERHLPTYVPNAICLHYNAPFNFAKTEGKCIPYDIIPEQRCKVIENSFSDSMLLKPDTHQFQQMIAECSTHEGYKETFQKVLTPDMLKSRF